MTVDIFSVRKDENGPELTVGQPNSNLKKYDLLEFCCCSANMEIKPKDKEHYALAGRLFY